MKLDIHCLRESLTVARREIAEREDESEDFVADRRRQVRVAERCNRWRQSQRAGYTEVARSRREHVSVAEENLPQRRTVRKPQTNLFLEVL